MPARDMSAGISCAGNGRHLSVPGAGAVACLCQLLLAGRYRGTRVAFPLGSAERRDVFVDVRYFPECLGGYLPAQSAERRVVFRFLILPVWRAGSARHFVGVGET